MIRYAVCYPARSICGDPEPQLYAEFKKLEKAIAEAERLSAFTRHAWVERWFDAGSKDGAKGPKTRTWIQNRFGVLPEHVVAVFHADGHLVRRREIAVPEIRSLLDRGTISA